MSRTKTQTKEIELTRENALMLKAPKAEISVRRYQEKYVLRVMIPFHSKEDARDLYDVLK